MKKVTKKKLKEVKPEEKIEMVMPATEEAYVTPKVGKLTVSFPSEDMNKVVDKINEIIENL